jgi:hypothetical protein
MFFVPLHPVINCHCGRVIHWPRNVRPGEQRVCFQCGRVWTWTANMAPNANTRTAHYEPSRGPRRR